MATIELPLIGTFERYDLILKDASKIKYMAFPEDAPPFMRCEDGEIKVCYTDLKYDEVNDIFIARLACAGELYAVCRKYKMVDTGETRFKISGHDIKLVMPD